MECRSVTCKTLMLLDANRANPSDDGSIVTRVCWSGVVLPAAQPSVAVAVLMLLSVLLTAPVDPFLFKWVLMCLDKWSLRMKRLGHSGHENFFSPVNRQKANLTVCVNMKATANHGTYKSQFVLFNMKDLKQTALKLISWFWCLIRVKAKGLDTRDHELRIQFPQWRN